MALKKMTLIINGVERMLVCDPEQDSLADVLRRLGLTGTKIGCNAGQCGACSVLLDGKVVRSCARKMKSVPEYSRVVTIEGIGTPTNLHPLQLAWIVYGGVQCGFCTPGFIVSAKGLLDNNPNPTRQEVRDWFQKHRNACRCTGYKPLVDAVMAAAKVLRGEMTMEELSFKIPEDGRIYNTAYPRPAALAKVTGTCDYGADINMKLPPGVLHVAVVQARVSHARVISIDTSEAEKMPGVVKVITHKDVKGTNRLFLPLGTPTSKKPGNERPILVEDTIYRYGDICALVAAYSDREAREAAKKVKVHYEPLPEYLDLLDAVAEDAMEIHPGYPNLYMEQPIIHGEDTKKIMETAPYVVEASYYTQRQPHLVIEPDVLLAYPNEEGGVTIHSKSLALYLIKTAIADGIGVPAGKIRAIENPTGASFGYTISPGGPALVAVATLATGKPCALQFSYEEHHHFSGKRAPSYVNLKMAADENGKILAMEAELALDKGAYSEHSTVMSRAIRCLGAPYHIPNALVLGKVVCTNNCFSTAFRAFGAPQAFAASEQIIDELAEKVGMDPLEFRYLNALRPGEKSILGHEYSVYPYPELLERMRPKYREALERAKRESTPEKRRGVGIACGQYVTASNIVDHSEVAMELNPDGTVTVYNTWQDQGQGGDIGTLVHAHEALRPLNLKPEQIRLVMNDTGICPNSGLSGASRQHYMTGSAIIDAAQKLLAAMRKPDGTYRTYEEMVKEGIPTKYLGVHDITGMCTNMDPNTGQGNPTPEYAFGCFLAEVEVDTTTGKTKVLKMAVIGDIGVVGSVQAVEGQAYGGLAQGVGLALSENYEDYEKHTNFISCGFPYINDIPDDLEAEHLEIPRKGPHGSVGCAEMYLSAPHAAIINAIYNACGVRIRELPATPDKVLAGLKALEKGEVSKPKKYFLGSDLHERIDYLKKHPIVS